jgi:Protein of unknown function (DUF3108)
LNRWGFPGLGVLTLAAAAILLTGCGSGGGAAPTSKIFRAPSWQSAETLTYRVTREGVDGAGTCVFITPATKEGPANFEQHCTKDQFGDDRIAQADAQTLTPIRTDRVNSDTAKGTRVTHSIVYGPTSARFTTDDGKKSRETERDLPEPDANSPEPGWYDDDTLFWLARGIPLEEGWEGGYTHVINAGQPRVLPVEVSVPAQETVKVPAGEFRTWRLRFQRGSTVHTLWVDLESPNVVVRAQIEDVGYELVSVK